MEPAHSSQARFCPNFSAPALSNQLITNNLQEKIVFSERILEQPTCRPLSSPSLMVKKVLLTQIYLLATFITSHAGLEKQGSTNPYDLQTGDLVFQGGNDLQAKAVKAASHSRWSHVGLVFFYKVRKNF